MVLVSVLLNYEPELWIVGKITLSVEKGAVKRHVDRKSLLLIRH